MDLPVWNSKSDSITFVLMLALVFLSILSFLCFRAFGGPLGQITGPLDARFSRLWSSIRGKATCIRQ